MWRYFPWVLKGISDSLGPRAGAKAPENVGAKKVSVSVPQMGKSPIPFEPKNDEDMLELLLERGEWGFAKSWAGSIYYGEPEKMHAFLCRLDELMKPPEPGPKLENKEIFRKALDASRERLMEKFNSPSLRERDEEVCLDLIKADTARRMRVDLVDFERKLVLLDLTEENMVHARTAFAQLNEILTEACDKVLRKL